MRTGEIKALSGLRIVAAVWVVLFHYRPILAEAAPGFRSALKPILDCGAQGVDLFFILSGFVLAWNYLHKMGEGWSARDTLHFLWLRLARVWPVYLVTMHLAAAWLIFTLHVGHVPSPDIGTLTAPNYLRQFFLVQLWTEPYFDGTSWDGPAWSISAEWLAYLLFGVLALVIYRVASATRARGLILMGIAATLPPVVMLLASGHFYTPWSWLPRIVMQFTAGMLACAAVRKLDLSERARKIAGYLSLVIAGIIVGFVYWIDAHPIDGMIDGPGLVDLLLVPLVVSLAVGVGSLPRVLSLRPLVYGGYISFSLYMIHEIVHTAWNWAVVQFEIDLQPTFWGKMTVLGILSVAALGAVILYHFVEEPARVWMRRMVDFRKPKAEPVPTEPADEPVDDAGDTEDVEDVEVHDGHRLQPIHAAREERRDAVSARAV